MKTRRARLSKLVPLAALLLASGLAQGAQPPRVMFVSGQDAKPVLVDPAGKEIVAKKGQVIPPGFVVKVPEGATVQIMTEEKAIVAVRQNSLLKIERLGDGDKPHLLKLDRGGLRVANSDKKPHKFEVDTPNAKVRFDKGDHEAYYFQDGNKVTGERWGTFVRGFKDESVLSTKDGDQRIGSKVIGYVPGAGKDGKIELIDRIKTGDLLSNPVAAKMQGGAPVTDLNENQRRLGENTIDPSTGGAPVKGMPGPAENPRPILTTPVTAGSIKTAQDTSAVVKTRELYVVGTRAVLVEDTSVSLLSKTQDTRASTKIPLAEIPKAPANPPVGNVATREQAAGQIKEVLNTRTIRGVQ